MPYLRASSGRCETSTVSRRRPSPAQPPLRARQSVQSGCVNWTTRSSAAPARRARRSRSIRSSWPRANAAEAGAEPVGLAAGAEPGRGGQEREGRDEQAERPAERVGPDREGDRRCAEERPRRAGSRSAAAASPRSVPRRDAAGRARSTRGTGGTSAARASARRRAERRESRTAATSPTRKAVSASDPMTSWLNRGARASMTSRSRYGSAERRFISESYTKMGLCRAST